MNLPMMVLLSIFTLATFAQPALAEQNLPGTGARAVSTFNSLGLYWNPGTNPGTAGCVVTYRKVGDTAWKEGLNMWYDSRNGECRGSLVQLSSGTSYDVQFALPGQSPSRGLTVKTWSENFPIARTVYVSNSSQTLNITSGGTASGYVLYTPAPGTTATIDVANSMDSSVQISAPYVIVRGLTLKGARINGVTIAESAHDVVIEDNDISGWGRSSGKTSSLGYTIGTDYDSGIFGRCSNKGLVRVVAQRNKIHDPRYGANSWTDGHPLGPQGITLYSCGGNHVLRYNEIYSTAGKTTGHYFNDGLGGGDNFSTVGFPNADSDIYGNRIENAWDDCIEAEGSDANVRIYQNYCNNTATGVASTVVATGPLYIFRNVYNRSRMLEGASLDSDTRNTFAKSGSNSLGGGRRYIFHNTLLQATQSGATYPLGAGYAISKAGLSVTNTVSRNNIFHIWKSRSIYDLGSGSGNSLNYDLSNGSSGEANGIIGTPIYAPGNGWTSEHNGMYQLASNSPGFDKGAAIPNFNDNHIGAGPDMGAHEAGSGPMPIGVKAGGAPSTPPPAATPAPTPTPTPVATVTPTPAPTATPAPSPVPALGITMEAESMSLSGYYVKDSAFPAFIKVNASSPGSTGTAKATFTGITGIYSLAMTVGSEPDGQGKYALKVDGVTVKSFVAPLSSGTAIVSPAVVTATGISLKNSSVIEVVGTMSGPDHARLDKLVFTLSSSTSPTPTPPPATSPTPTPTPSTSTPVALSDILGQAQADVLFSQQSKWNAQVLATYPSASSIPETGINGTVLPSGEKIRFGKVANPTNTSKKALVFQVASSDPNTSGSKRSEITFGGRIPIVNNKDYWIAYSVYVPTPTSITNEDHIFGTQLHLADNVGLAYPPFSVHGTGSQMYVRVLSTNASSPSNSSYTKRVSTNSPILYNQWMDIVIRIKPGFASDAGVQVWKNGTLWFDFKGPVGVIDSVMNSNPGYMKFGYYNYNMPSGYRKILMRSPVIVQDPTKKYKADDLRRLVNTH